MICLPNYSMVSPTQSRNITRNRQTFSSSSTTVEYNHPRESTICVEYSIRVDSMLCVASNSWFDRVFEITFHSDFFDITFCSFLTFNCFSGVLGLWRRYGVVERGVLGFWTPAVYARREHHDFVHFWEIFDSGIFRFRAPGINISWIYVSFPSESQGIHVFRVEVASAHPWRTYLNGVC